jgi:hypothetical protein
MNAPRSGRCSVLLVGTLMLAGCSSSVYHDVFPTLSDGRYDSEFPYKGCSKQLEEIAETVNMLSSIAYYRTYTFPMEDRITRGDVTDTLLQRKRKESVYVNSTASGTATVIFYDERRVMLLTCAHVVDFEDTVFSFYITPEHRITPWLKTVAIKEKQTNYVAVFPEGGELDILALDRAADIALLGKQFSGQPANRIAAFRYPFGKAKDLEWGTFVYMFGYPSGFKMVTKGIVSNPNKDKRGSFMVDAMFSRGFSGGITLAIRDGVPNFELVGIVKLVSARSSFVLSPEKENGEVVYDPAIPYTGAVYVERKTEIESGLTQAVPVEAIKEFIKIQTPLLREKGYIIGNLFKTE